MYAGVFMQIDSKDGTGHIYLCTCDADVIAKQLHGGVSFVDYLAGHVFESITIEGSADISGGNGFFAAPAGGEIVIADDDGTLAISLLDGSRGLIGGRVYIAHRTQDGVMHKLYQLLVTEAGINNDGSISITCKTPSAEANAMMHKSAAVTQLLTGPDDPANPTDPTYLEEAQANVIAGTAFGGVPVSLKAGDGISSCVLCRFEKGYKKGRIDGSSNSDGNLASIFASRFGDQDADHYTGGSMPTEYGSAAYFDCRDLTEANRLFNQINQFKLNGYKIVISSGDWFLDIDSFTPWNGPLFLDFYSYITTNNGKAFDVANDGAGEYFVFFCLTDNNGTPLFPKGGIDPTSVKICAIPKTIPVSSDSVVIDGFAKNKKTIPVAGIANKSSGVFMLSPVGFTGEDILSTEPVSYSILYDNNLTETHNPGSAVECNGPNPDAADIKADGSTLDINTDPKIATIPGGIGFGNYGVQWEWLNYARMKMRIDKKEIQCDMASSDVTFDVDAVGIYSPIGDHSVTINVSAPFSDGVTHHKKFSPAGSIGWSVKAPNNRIFPNWRALFNSPSDLDSRATPAIAPKNGTEDKVQSLILYIREVFLWAHTRFSIGNIYSTIYPFWTRKNCGNLAYGAGTLVAGGAGRGTQIQPNGEIAWEPFDLPTPFGSTATVTGTAYGTVGLAPYWLSVGYTQSGSTQTPACWISDDDGATWRQDAGYQTASIPTSIRNVNGQLVATRTDGSLDIVIGFSSPNMIWSTVATGATQINDIAFGVDTYIVVGNGGQARRSTNLSSWIAWNWSGGDDLLCVCYSQSGIGGYFHVGVNSGLIGTVFRKYDGSDAWTAFPLPLGDKVTAIMDSDGDVVAMNPGSVYARSPGLTDTAWKDRYSIGDNSGDVGGVAFSADGANHLVVGANAQILTSPSFLQGSSFEATYAGVPDWTPWGAKTPSMALDHLIVQKLGGTADNWNPVRFSRKSPLYSAFGVAFDPPSANEGAASGTTVLEALRKICKEWWCFAGDIPVAKLDGSADAIEAMIPDVKMGNREDVYTQITAQYQPFGGEYLGRAYIQNVDKAYVAGNDALYFGGWDLPGANTFGLLLWQRCRDAYLATGVLRETSLTFDSVQDAATLGALWVMEDQDLGERILWLCRQPRYYRVTVRGNESAAALANVGCRYKPNATLLTERGLDLGITGYGVVVESSHDPVGARHELLIAFPPEQPT